MYNYSTLVYFCRLDSEKPCSILWSTKLHKTDERARAIAEKCGRGNAEYTKRFGYHGVSVLHKILPYLSYIDFWLVPVGHSLLYGVVRNFVSTLLVSIWWFQFPLTYFIHSFLF